MKKETYYLTIPILLLLSCMGLRAHAQCSSTYTGTQPGLYPTPDSFPCIERGVYNSYVISFKNYDTTRVAGTLITIDSVKIDTIGNLPCGYKWLSNKARNIFANNDTGCILIWGKTCDPVGQYRLNIAVTAYIGGAGLPYNAATLGLRYDVRVIDRGDVCPMIDTSKQGQTASCGNGSVSIYGPPYDPSDSSHMNYTPCTNGISTIDTPIGSFYNYPNPFTDATEVVFIAFKESPITLKVYDLLGKVVWEEKFTAINGQNALPINGKGLQPGMYIYSISDGAQTVNGRMVKAK